MKAAILAIGSELLGTMRLDTNSLAIAELLERYGVELRGKAVMGDSEKDIAAQLRHFLYGADSAAEANGLIIITGGLGPTSDDVTRPAVARALGRTITLREELVEVIRERFRGMGLEMPEVNRRQAEVIDGAAVLDNPRGSAPGLRLREGNVTLFLFPGVPSELRGMMAEYLVPWLEENTAGTLRETGVLKVACMPESTLEERIAPAYEEMGREVITVLAKPGDIEVRFSAEGDEAERRESLRAMRDRLTGLIGRAVYAQRETTLEETVGELLRAAHGGVGATVATAESCTGGLVAERITRVPGSSSYFVGAAVTYSNALKISELRVPAELIEAHGAVSEEVAQAMAEGARERFGVDYALALTGIAGPGGGTEDKPVGTVHIALAGPHGLELHRRIGYPGERQRIRWLSSQVALEMLRRALLRPEPSSAPARTIG